MRAMPVLLLLVSAAASADELYCPDVYPDKPISLPRPSGQAGAGLVKTAGFSNAYLYAGKLHADAFGFDAQVGRTERKRVKGGWNTTYNFTPSETKWLVCAYGGNELSRHTDRQGPIEWWQPISLASTRCTLQFREVKRPYNLPSSWRASAVCREG